MPAAFKTTILRNGSFIIFLVIATAWMNAYVVFFLLGAFAVTLPDRPLSPTIYAPGHRILPVMELSLVIYVCALIEALLMQRRARHAPRPQAPDPSSTV